MKTGYFVLPAKDISGYKSKLISKDHFLVEKDVKGEITAITGKSAIKIDPKLIEGKDGKVAPGETKTEETINPEFELQGRVIATLKSGEKISHAIIPDTLHYNALPYIAAVKEIISADMFELSNQETLGIVGKFIGYSRKDVLRAYPELEGQRQIGVDEKDKPIMADKLTKHMWSGEI